MPDLESCDTSFPSQNTRSKQQINGKGFEGSSSSVAKVKIAVLPQEKPQCAKSLQGKSGRDASASKSSSMSAGAASEYQSEGLSTGTTNTVTSKASSRKPPKENSKQKPSSGTHQPGASKRNVRDNESEGEDKHVPLNYNDVSGLTDKQNVSKEVVKENRLPQ